MSLLQTVCGIVNQQLLGYNNDMSALTPAQLKAFYQELGRNIKRARTSAGSLAPTQEDLAKKIGLTRTSITNIEKGRQRIMLHTLFEISIALGVALSALVPEISKEGKIKIPGSVSKEVSKFIGSILNESNSEESHGS